MEQYTNPRIWGPHFWYILKCVVYNYPMSPSNADKQHMECFFSELQYALPCEKCKYTFKQHYNKFPICKYLNDRTKLVEWLDLMYDETNRAIAKNRVKILDEYIDTGDMAPLKQIPKNEKDKVLEKQLNEIKKNVTKNATNNNVTLMNNAINDAKVGRKTHVFNNDVLPFDKQANGKKNPEKIVTPKPVTKPVAINPPLINNVQIIQQQITMPPITKHLSKTDKITIQQKQIFEVPKTLIQPQPKQIIPQQKSLSITQTPFKINQLSQIHKKPNPPPETIQKIKPTQTLLNAQQKAKSITYSNLTVISKCKKCQQ